MKLIKSLLQSPLSVFFTARTAIIFPIAILLSIITTALFFYYHDLFSEPPHLVWDLVIAINLTMLVAGLLFHIHQKNNFKDLYLAQLQLAETREWFRTTLYSIGDGVIAADTTGRIRQMNPTAEQLTGWTEREAFDRPLAEVFNVFKRTSLQKTDDLVALIVEKGRATDLAKHTILVSKDGAKRPISDSGAPIKNPKGDVIGVVITFRDQSKKRQMESDLKAGEARYKALVNSAANHLYMLDLNGIYLSSNDRVKGLGLETGNQIVGKKIEDVFKNEAGKLFQAKFNQVVKYLEPINFEDQIKTDDGRLVDYETTLYPILSEDKIWAVGGIGRDVTKYKMLAKQYRQAQKMEAIGQLAGGVAHDFNNMLGIIIGYAQICLNHLTPEDIIYEDLNEILFAARRSKDITGQLLAFARQQAIAPKVLNINAIITQNERMLMRLIGEEIELKFYPCSDLWPIKIDPAQLHQILTNLAINARDAINGVGKITLKTSNIVLDDEFCDVHQGSRCGDFVLLTFSDSGMGMDLETINKIFDPFFTTKLEGKGTGLGLSTVYGIIKQNDGFINVNSEPGGGSIFKIFLPRVDEEYDDISDDSINDQITGSETILVVEDEIQVIGLCRRILSPLGYKLLTAQTPTEAISLCQNLKTPIDLLLSDIIMPSMNGKELAERLTDLKPDLKTLFMSGYTSNVIANRGILPQDMNIIPKPFTPNELATKIRKVLDK